MERDTALQPQSLFFCLSLCPVSSSVQHLLYVFLLLSSILFCTLDEVQLCIGHTFLNPLMELQPPLFPPFSHFYPVFPLVFSLSFLSANEAAPHSLSSERDRYMGLGVSLTLMSLLFEIHHFHFCFYQNTAVYILYVSVFCLSSLSSFLSFSSVFLSTQKERTLPNDFNN